MTFDTAHNIVMLMLGLVIVGLWQWYSGYPLAGLVTGIGGVVGALLLVKTFCFSPNDKRCKQNNKWKIE